VFAEHRFSERLRRSSGRRAGRRVRPPALGAVRIVAALPAGFALAYGACFFVIGRSVWWLGAILGALHAVFISTVLVNVLLPIVHPRMATADTAANEVALLEPPGFLMLNYGRNTFLVTLAAHVAYGAILGAVVRV
jgi:hypothetical protein